MALVQKRSQNNRRIVILLGLLVVFGVLTLLILSGNLFGSSPSGDATVSPSNPNVRDLPVYSDLGEEILSDTRLDTLQIHGSFPIRLGQPGRNNPFVESSGTTTQ